jgi:dipeptidyl aminopeptidase/acylaminoacyl peptidase
MAVTCASVFTHSIAAHAQTAKPKLTIDDLFNSVSFDGVSVSPDGNSVIVATERADWEQQIFRKELWLYRIAGGNSSSANLVQLTQSGHDSSAQWSPDGKWIAFLSERKSGDAKDPDAGDDKTKEVSQLFLISPSGGEALAVTSGDEDVHAFVWSSDSKAIYFATRQPWTTQQTDDHKKEWKDVIRFRGDERGDVLYRLSLDEALSRHAALGAKEAGDAEKDANVTPGAVAIARLALRMDQITVSRDGKRLAFVSNSVSQRQEKMDDNEIYLVNLTADTTTATTAEVAPIRLTHNEAEEVSLQWAPDNRHLYFRVDLGSTDKKYEDPQPRLYWVNSDNGAVERWFASFQGEVVHYTAMADGSAVCACRVGTEVQLYSQANPTAPIVKLEGWAGTYDIPDAARNSSRFVFAYSTSEKPSEVYVADGLDKLSQARAITAFNKFLTERDLPKAKPYHWTSDDGTQIEGMLMYPPEKFEAKDLPMFVLIHGGPQDADGDRFEADWYQWDRLAATAGWLVFEPNYRGSTGYGDAFTLQIVPDFLSRPGKDILTGVDALVKAGIANGDHLAVGGYSYGGYMTNWLITQTTRFKAAVTGAGGVENIADWGNDDSTADDEFILGGPPWQNPERCRGEAAIFQIDRVRTPTLMVAGADDIRVPVLESYLMERALHRLNVPSELLIFPGEGHSLDKNPWHGKIKVQQELKWLEKYGGVSASAPQ